MISKRTIIAVTLTCLLLTQHVALADNFLQDHSTRLLQTATLPFAQVFPAVTVADNHLKPAAENVDIQLAFKQPNTTPVGADRFKMVVTAPKNYVFDDADCKPANQPASTVTPKPNLDGNDCTPLTNGQFGTCIKGATANVAKITMTAAIAKQTNSCTWFSVKVKKVPDMSSTTADENKWKIQYNATLVSALFDGNDFARMAGWGDIVKPSSGAIGDVNKVSPVLRPNKVKKNTTNDMAIYTKPTTPLTDNSVVFVKLPSGFALTTGKECSATENGVSVKTCIKASATSSTCTDRAIGKIANNAVESGKVFGCAVVSATVLKLQKSTSAAPGAMMIKFKAKAPGSAKTKAGAATLYSCKTAPCTMPTNMAGYYGDANVRDYGLTLDDVQVEDSGAAVLAVAFSFFLAFFSA